MHYSAYAFSKNGKPTIMPLVCMITRYRSTLYSTTSVMILLKSMSVSVIKYTYLNIFYFKFYRALIKIYYILHSIGFGLCPCSSIPNSTINTQHFRNGIFLLSGTIVGRPIN
jgi:hypothetical protein